MCEGLNGISDRKPPGIGKIGSNPAFCLSQSAINRCRMSNVRRDDEQLQVSKN